MNYSDSLTLRQRLHAASVRAAQLEGARNSDAASQAQFTKNVAEAKGRRNLGEEIGRIFNALQQRAHERSVGAFERLLTAILNDVLPDEGAVRLLTQYKSNNTWLDVALEKGGKLEEVVDGNGGAVTNVICAGLRYAALSRTRNRRLMILDESDCWLKPTHVPAFVRVVAQVAQQTNTQTFFITLHDPALIEGYVNLVRLYADESDAVKAEPLAPLVTQWANDDEPGVRSIELINFRRHKHTVIPCFPGATAFIGENNLGKSAAIVSSFKAVGYGESDDTMIRHDCDEARIIFHLEQGRRIEWSRSLKRSPKVMYRLFEAGATTPSQEGRPKGVNQVPEWVTEVLGIARVDELDIQIGNQKEPVFLLNDTAPRRAQILSIGRESSHLKTLMKGYEELRGSDQEVIKQGELQLARLNFRLERLAKLSPVNETLAEMLIESEGMLQSLELREKLSTHTTRMGALVAAVAAAEQEAGALQSLPEQPVLLDTLKAEQLCKAMEGAQSRLHLTVPALPEIVELVDTSKIKLLGVAIANGEKSVTALARTPASVPSLPEMASHDNLLALMARLTANAERIVVVSKEDADAARLVQQQEKVLADLIKDLDGLCPLCGSAMTSDMNHSELAHEH